MAVQDSSSVKKLPLDSEKNKDSKPDASESDTKLVNTKPGKDAFTKRQILLLIAIVITYISIIPNRVFLSSINADLKDDPNIEYSNTKAGYLFVITGLGYAFGKLVDGFLIEKIGEIKCMVAFMVISSICVLSFSAATDVVGFAFWSVINAAVQAGTWPALIKLIYRLFEPAQFGTVFTFMGLGSKVGSFITKFVIGSLLLVMDWRSAVSIIASIGLSGAMFFAAVGFGWMDTNDETITVDKTENKSDAPNDDSKLGYIKSVLTNRRFLLMAGIQGSITISLGLESFSELMLVDTLGGSMPKGILIMCASTLPLGIVVALLISHFVLRNKPMEFMAHFVNTSMVLAVMVAILLGIWTFIVETRGCESDTICLFFASLLFFIDGLLLAYPYYVPPSLFLLDFGGARSATVSGILDLCGFIPSAFFLVGGSTLSEKGWRYVWLIFVPVIAMGTVFYSLFNRQYTKAKLKEE